MTREELLTDACDHIARVAGGSEVQTKRLRFIELRAKTALRGEPWNQYDTGLRHPRMAGMMLRRQKRVLCEALRMADAMLEDVGIHDSISPEKWFAFCDLMIGIEANIFGTEGDDVESDQQEEVAP